MKKFGEGLKDFIYDAIDYILMIAIVLVVAGIIFWRLNVLFDEKNINISSPKNDIEATDSNKVDNNKEDENTEKEEELVVENIEISIPAGSTSSAIADILVKEGLIEDPDQFILKARELGLETKLKSGEFNIDKNTSIEDIVKIIAQQK